MWVDSAKVVLWIVSRSGHLVRGVPDDAAP
jgi:hypothetical protein